jgi:hypothetical protein
MALIKCPECYNEISDKAVSCVRCGFPLELRESVLAEDIIECNSDESDDLESLIESAKKGDDFSKTELGIRYFEEKDYRNAIYWLTKGTKRGTVSVQRLLGLCYYNILEECRKLELKTDKQDREQAFYYLAISAEQGDSISQLFLGRFLEIGYLSERTREYDYGLGFYYDRTPDYEQALFWYTEAARQGHVEAQYLLGQLYYRGCISFALPLASPSLIKYCSLSHYIHKIESFRMSPDYKQAVYWYTEAAKQNHMEAKYSLGMYYADNFLDNHPSLCHGLGKDYEAAIYWLKKAYDQGHTSAPFWIGKCYEEGLGVSQDYENAFDWYSRAEERGDSWSRLQKKLGDFYYHGNGVYQDQYKAIELYAKAAANGDYEAKEILSVIVTAEDKKPDWEDEGYDYY